MWKWDYFFIKDFFSKEEIKKINQNIEQNHLSIEDTSKVSKYTESNKSKKKTKTYQINYGKIKPLLKNLEELANEINEANFGFDLYSLKSTSNVLLNVYDSKTKSQYDWHFDHSRSDIYDVKLTLLVNLSLKKYDGGSFEIFNSGSYKIKELDKPGSAILIKSYLNHKVNLVTKGERRTLTLFLKGPKLK
tara:strand:- start:572 stop:1141 length:570 start_codon:yes stop_codon:yes gene_type:complete